MDGLGNEVDWRGTVLVTVMEAEHNDDPTHYDMIFLHVFYDLGGGTKKGRAFLPRLSSRQSSIDRASGGAFWAISMAHNKTVSCSDLRWPYCSAPNTLLLSQSSPATKPGQHPTSCTFSVNKTREPQHATPRRGSHGGHPSGLQPPCTLHTYPPPGSRFDDKSHDMVPVTPS